MSDSMRTPSQTLAAVSVSERLPRYLTLDKHNAIVPVNYTNEELKALLGPRPGADLDFALVPPLYLSKDLCSDPALRARIELAESTAANRGELGGILASGDKAGCIPGRKTGLFVGIAQDMFEAFSPAPCIAVTKEDIAERCSQSLAYSGGTWLALRRIAEFYPSRTFNTRSLVVPTDLEVETAMARSGFSISIEERLPLIAEEPDDPAIKVTRDSDNGFPVMGTMADPGARELCLQLATTLRTRIDAAADKDAYVRHLRGQDPRVAKPLLFLCKGKVKYDVYTMDKVRGQQLRFYNVVPRPTLMVIQQAAQVVNANHKHVPLSNSAQGLGLARGGANTLARFLDPDVAPGINPFEVKYTHCGDDSWIVIGDGYTNALHMLSADCSSFDLTQHSRITEPIHKAFKGLLGAVDAGSAALWYSLMREREVTLYGTKTVAMRHAGPSGMPLQSAVNDVLMEVFLARLKERLEREYAQVEGKRSAAVIEKLARAAVEGIGKELGLRVRVDDWTTVPGTVSLPEALSRSAFKYVGYWFYSVGTEFEDVRVVCDLVRTMAGLPFPSTSVYEPDKTVNALKGAIKAVGVALSMGVPPMEWVPAWDAYTKRARNEITAVEKQLTEDSWEAVAAQISVFAGLDAGVLRTATGAGTFADRLRACLNEKFRYELWVGESVSSDEGDEALPEPGNWADEVDAAMASYDAELKAWQEERDRIKEALRSAGISDDAVKMRPPPVKPARMAVKAAVTWDNWGAPPQLMKTEQNKTATTGWTPVLTKGERKRGQRKTRGLQRSGVLLPEEGDYASPSESDEERPVAGAGRRTNWDEW